MTIPTHFLLGAIIGKVTGNYTVGILSSTLIDLDHLQSYVQHGLLLKPRKFWNTVTSQSDPYGNQRGILHNIILFCVVSVAMFFLFPKIGVLISVGWLGHLCLDTLDNSDYWPLYPNKSINLKGPIKYATIQEFLLFIILLVVYFYV